MKNKRLLTLIGGVCLVLVLASLPFMAACPAPVEEGCETDADCPEGYVCVNGACVPVEEEPPPEVIELTYGSINPATHTYSVADMAWIDKIEADTNGQVDIIPYWGATLVSKAESTAELAEGVADIAYCSPGYSSLPYPIHNGTLGFFFGAPDYETRRLIYDELTAKFPEIEAEFEGIKILCTSVGSTYQLVSNRPVRTLADFQGLQVKGTGVFLEVLKELGCEGISMPMTDVYIALEKGTIDACLAPYETFSSLHFEDVAKYVTVLDMPGSVYLTRAINPDVYNSLPANVRQIFDDSITFWKQADDDGRFSKDQAGYDIAVQAGVEIIELSAADLVMVYEALETVMLAKAAELDDQGLPGTEIYEEIRRLVEKYTTPP